MSFDSLERAEVIRSKIMKDGKYLIARIEKGEQERDPKKILDDFFRYKEYIKRKEWISASLEEIWSPKFLGLSDNFKSKQVREVKKLEFQNPAYSAAFRLGGDPRNYRKVFTVQIAGCDFDCNYCYVPKKINAASPEFGKYFSAKEIIDYFLSAREKSKEPMKVIRISGGNPTIVPEIIVDIYSEIKSQNLDVYLWIDSNLSTQKYLENLKGDFKNIISQKNVGLVGCFKGFCEEDFEKISGVESKFYDRQFETAKWFLDNKTDFYVYVPALVYKEERVEEKLRRFVEKQKSLNEKLPLRTEILPVIDYPGAVLNYKRAEKLGRPLPETNQRIVFNAWYKLLSQFYPKEELEKYCCQISLFCERKTTPM